MADKINDEWGKKVLKRLNRVMCLVTEESKYQRVCKRQFCIQLPIDGTKKNARLQDKDLTDAFANLCDFLGTENECQFSLNISYVNINNLLNFKFNRIYRLLCKCTRLKTIRI